MGCLLRRGNALLLRLDLLLVEKEDDVLPHQLLDGDLLLLVLERLPGQPLHHIEVLDVRVHSMRDEQVLDLLQHLLEHLDLLDGHLLVAGQSLVERGVEPVVLLHRDGRVPRG